MRGTDLISIIIPHAIEKNINIMVEQTERCFPDAQIIIATDRYRKGKGWAIRQALEYAKGDIIVFIDGDGDILPSMIKRLLPHLDEFDIVVGKKDTRSMFSRWALTVLSRLYIRALFNIPVDTQTGVKVFKRSALPSWEEDGFSFDIEILSKAKRAGASMFEVTINASCTRKMKMISVLNSLLGSLRIWKKLS